MEQVFAIQSNIADCVAEELNVAILGRERQALHMKPTENLLAYDYYLRGREYEERGIDRNATEISIELYHKAAQEDPGFAQAYARICLQHCRMYWHAWDQTEGRRTNAKEAIDKAISLEPDDPLVRAANGYYYYYCMRDYARALKEFSRARQSEPGNSFYLSSISFVQGRLGKFDDSLNNMLAAFKYDPRSAMIAYGLSGAYNNLRRYEEAEKQCDRAISLAPDVGVYYVYKAGILINKTGNTTKAREVVREYMTRFGIESCWDLVYFDVFDGKYQNAMEGLELIDEEVDTRQGLYKPKDSIRGDIYALTGQTELSIHHYNKALAMLEKDINDRPDDVRIHAELGQVYAHLGQRDKALIEAQKIIELEPVTRDAGRGGWYLTFVAAIHTILGDYDEALDILERLPNNSSFPFCGYIGALKVNPVWAPLSDEPRFMRLMDSIAGTKT
jgi:tetratricopeptide (TPR) repeat protein